MTSGSVQDNKPAINSEVSSFQSQVEQADNRISFLVCAPHRPDAIKITTSESDMVHEVKMYLMDLSELRGLSCFHLSFNGQTLDETMTVADIPGFSAGKKIDIVPELYTERDARIHMVRFFELAQARRYSTTEGAVSYFRDVSGDVELAFNADSAAEKQPSKSHAFTNYEFPKTLDLASYLPGSDVQETPLVADISLCTWNPPSHQRKLNGDLFYLSVRTLENKVFTVTASARGFYVNQSTETNFNPSPSTNPNTFSLTFIGLMEKLSAKFASGYKALHAEMKSMFSTHESVPVVQPAFPWVGLEQKPNTDYRKQLTTKNAFFSSDAIYQTNLRDFNEDLQQARELPKSNYQERIQRDRQIQRIYTEFVEAATKSAIDIVEGNVPALNASDSKETQMFLHNNIFFSFGVDGRRIFSEMGGDEAARITFDKDLEALKIWDTVDADQLYTIATALIEFKGHIVVAQSMVPGILRRSTAMNSPIIYGTIDETGEIVAEEKFVELSRQLAKPLHLEEHKILSHENKELNVSLSLDSKGLMGSDGRRYAIELYRLTPVDPTFLEYAADEQRPYPHQYPLLRNELLDLFVDFKHREHIRSVTEKHKNENGEDTPINIESIDPKLLEFSLNFNSDCFTALQLADTKEKIGKDQQNIRDAVNYLLEQMLPNLVRDMYSFATVPIDGISLTNAMHRRGINMRYLGRLCDLIDEEEKKQGKNRADMLKKLCWTEMIVRSAKHMFRKLMRSIDAGDELLAATHFLNCFLGKNQYDSSRMEKEYKLETKFGISPLLLWKQITEGVECRFRYAIPDSFFASESFPYLSLLRSFCLRVGLQIQAKNYLFESSIAPIPSSGKSPVKKKLASSAAAHVLSLPTFENAVFVPGDILAFLPIVKSAVSKSISATETFESAKLTLAAATPENQPAALDLLNDTLSIYENVYGPVHPETAKVYAFLAMTYFNRSELPRAKEMQIKATVVSERCTGTDSQETVHNYLNLAYFCFASGQTHLALRYMRHAMTMWELVNPFGHPDGAIADGNIGLMLETIGDHERARQFLERSMHRYEATHGKEDAQTATSYHAMAKSFCQTHEFRAAMDYEKRAYKIFESIYGKEDVQTQESNTWLMQLTSFAVKAAKNGTLPLQLTSKSTPNMQMHSAEQIDMSQKPIDEVLAFINGSSGSKKKRSRKKTANKNIASPPMQGR